MYVVHIESGRHLYGGARQVLHLIAGLERFGVRNRLICAAGSEIAKAAADASLCETLELPMRGDAEAAAAVTVVGTMRSALGMEVAARIVRPGSEVDALAGANPMRLLSERPDNYLGEVDGVPPENLPPGHWYFDLASRELVYLVRYDQYFRTELPGPPRLVFQVELDYNEREELAGVRLRRVNEYVWTQSAETAALLSGQR